MGKKKAAPSTESGESTPPALQKPKTFQAFERMTAMRSQLRPHEANPRTIDSSALKKLREALRKVGLVTSLIVNRRDVTNGHPPAHQGQLVIIGGHQRCRAMDELRSYDPATNENDYQIPIDVLSVSPAKERELIVFLNNTSAQGAWDYSLLGDLLTSPDVDPLATGFDRLELSQILDAGIIEQLFPGTSPQAAAEAPILDAIAQVAADSKAYQDARKPTPAGIAPPSSPGLHETTQSPADAPAPQGTPALGDDDINSVPNIKGRRYDFRDKTAEAGSSSHILTLVANSGDELDNFLIMIGLTNEAFIDLSRFITAIDSAAGTDFDEALRISAVGDTEADAVAGDLQESPDPA